MKLLRSKKSSLSAAKNFTSPWCVWSAFALVAVAVFASAASAGGNSASAKLCQKGGWTNLVRQDNTPFNSEEECVSYGAQGGTPIPPTAAQSTCHTNGGFFDTGPDASPPFLWRCNMFPNLISKTAASALSDICITDGGTPSFMRGLEGSGPFGLECAVPVP